MPIEKKTVEVTKLLFDPNNPRLPSTFDGDQRQIFRFLVDEIGVEDLLNSIAASGVIEGDPIIARAAERNDEYYVIEGNRRIAALKLLNGEKIRDGQTEPTVPAIANGVTESLRNVTIQLGWENDKLEAYLGYKHVTATREWPPEAKARFVLKHCNNDFSPENLSRFAKRLGTKLPTLRRWLIAFLTLTQAEAAGRFDPGEAYSKRYFGTFYTLLGSQEVQRFLGLRSDVLTAQPVPQENLDQLTEFISWTIGTKKHPPLINSRSQQKLDAVLSSPGAIQYFRAKGNIDAALLYTEANSGEIAEKLLNAAFTIEECLPKVFDVKDDPKIISAMKNLDRAFDKLKLNTAERPKQ
jgi:ParB-like nuclease family protein